MPSEELFESNPRDYAIVLIEEGMIDSGTIVTACLKYMSHDDVRDMLDCNDLSP